MELPSYFARFLRTIQPSRASRERAIQLHTTLRERLKATDDPVFTSWYTRSFLYGSYIRNTAIQPIKDVDVCIVLGLKIEECTPEQVIRRLKNVLEKMGYEDKTVYQHRSIRIDMSGTTIDAVPVIPVDSEDLLLCIPDRQLKEWIYTHPKKHMKATTRINKECGGRYIPFVKIVKAWYRYQAKQKRGIERPKPKGFTLEALVAHFQDPDAPTYAEAFVNFLQNLMNNWGDSLKSGIFPEVPDPGSTEETLKITVELDEAVLFAEIIEESLSLAEQACAAETYGESASLWREVFGNDFPDAPAAIKSMGANEISEITEGDEEIVFDPLLEAEISEVELPSLPVVTSKLKLTAELSQRSKGETYQHYRSASRAIPKGTWILFSIANTTVSPPYEIRWTVNNHGKEAQAANQMSHEHTTSYEKPYHWEEAKYRGSHHMICEIIKSGVVIAHAKHTVNVR